MQTSKKIYGNCKVLAPNGELMFRCNQKRVNWYLDRDLAVAVDGDDTVIQLTFKPKGMGDPKPFKQIRENKCVVCGETEDLTRHHVVPYEYRKHFPEQLKSRNSWYVVPLCENCHDNYENNYAKLYKLELEKKYNAPRHISNESEDNRLKALLSKKLMPLIEHYDKIPSNRISQLKSESLAYLHQMGCNATIEELNPRTFPIYLDKFQAEGSKNEANHGKTVVEKCEDIQTFISSWVDHFIESMNPKYMPYDLK